MLQWYRGQAKQHGVIEATRLFCRVGWARVSADLANKTLPEKLACPCCGWQGRRFYDYVEVGYRVPNSVCPRCDSHGRHRAFHLWLSREYSLQARSGVALIFAAEGALASLWQNHDKLKVYRIDIEMKRGRDLLGDLTHLPIATSAVDLLWCHHVLEHIEDDRAAIRELYRVLCPGKGELIVSVPMNNGRATEEFGFCDLAQSGHWRIYGDDFAERLREGGFRVTAIDYRPLAADLKRYRIVPEHFYICTKAEFGSEVPPALE